MNIIDFVETKLTPEAQVQAFKGIASKALSQTIFAVNSMISFPAVDVPTLDLRNEQDHEREGVNDGIMGFERNQTTLERVNKWLAIYLYARDRNMSMTDNQFDQVQDLVGRAEYLAALEPSINKQQAEQAVALLSLNSEQAEAVRKEMLRTAKVNQTRLKENIPEIISWIESSTGSNYGLNEAIDACNEIEQSSLFNSALKTLSAKMVNAAARPSELGLAFILKNSLDAFYAWRLPA